MGRDHGFLDVVNTMAVTAMYDQDTEDMESYARELEKKEREREGSYASSSYSARDDNDDFPKSDDGDDWYYDDDFDRKKRRRRSDDDDDWLFQDEDDDIDDDDDDRDLVCGEDKKGHKSKIRESRIESPRCKPGRVGGYYDRTASDGEENPKWVEEDRWLDWWNRGLVGTLVDWDGTDGFYALPFTDVIISNMSGRVMGREWIDSETYYSYEYLGRAKGITAETIAYYLAFPKEWSEPSLRHDKPFFSVSNEGSLASASDGTDKSWGNAAPVVEATNAGAAIFGGLSEKESSTRGMDDVLASLGLESSGGSAGSGSGAAASNASCDQKGASHKDVAGNSAREGRFGKDDDGASVQMSGSHKLASSASSPKSNSTKTEDSSTEDIEAAKALRELGLGDKFDNLLGVEELADGGLVKAKEKEPYKGPVAPKKTGLPPIVVIAISVVIVFVCMMMVLFLSPSNHSTSTSSKSSVAPMKVVDGNGNVANSSSSSGTASASDDGDEEEEEDTKPKGLSKKLPYVGLSVDYVNDTYLGKYDWSSPNKINSIYTEKYRLYWTSENEWNDVVFRVTVKGGKVIEAEKVNEDTEYWPKGSKYPNLKASGLDAGQIYEDRTGTKGSSEDETADNVPDPADYGSATAYADAEEDWFREHGYANPYEAAYDYFNQYGDEEDYEE